MEGPDMTGVSEIKRIIPHRYPILLVDRVVEVRPGDRLTALKAVTCNEPCYQRLDDTAGPADYAYPASLLLESWAQAAVLLAVWEQPNPDVLAGKVELAGSIRNARFRGKALPGDVLEHQAGILRTVGDTAILAGRTVVGSSTVLEVDHFVLALRDAGILRRSPLPAVG
jgi:3-hydroxyacyl-[acyl-carrier-protein] dehydratase